jgi:transcriptional regulator with XRE-family HTH domain
MESKDCGIDRKSFGALLKKARRSLNLSQAALAKTAGVTAVFISQIETGIRAPSDRVAKRLAVTLGLPWQEVLRTVYLLRSREAGELFADSDVQREPGWRSATDVPSLRLLLLQLASLKFPPSDIERLVGNWNNDVEFLKAQLNRVKKQAG